mmetsp:Transcript_56620/g.134881  ORF Transcript_56620/g.134881 Transcript_56620/m.134881 type:complete len:227 (+) Transcript_56620:103-783(+)
MAAIASPCPRLLRALVVVVAAWYVCNRMALSRAFAGLVSRGTMQQKGVDRKQSAAMRAVGLLYATQTGNTEEVAFLISSATGLDITAVDDLYASDLNGYDGLIVGCPTWNTGADEYRSGTAWDDLLEDIKGLSLSGKPVAVFGCGDSVGYGDNFCDAIEELHDTFADAGAKSIGYVAESGYTYAESKSVRNGKFLGLPLDLDNEADMSEERVADWVSQLKSEGMPF